jgi:hypothetical protein
MNRRKAIVRAPSAPVALPSASPSLASMASQGFAWGAGNAAAHALINATFSKPPVTTPAEYQQCMKDFDDKEACKHLLKQLF